MADKPNTAAKADPKKLMTFAELTAMKVGDLAAYCKKIVRVDLAINKARDAFTKSLKFNAKVVAALKRAHAEKRDSREIPGDWTFKDYFKNVAGGDLPGRVETLAALFNSLCLTLDALGKPLLSEENFDAAADDWLEKANPIIKQAQKQHGDAWKTSDDVLDVINALSKPGDALKTIKEIRARQKGEQPEGDESAMAAQPLTVGRAIEFLKAAIKNGGAAVATGKQAEAFALFCQTFVLHETWSESGLSNDTLLGWTGKYEKAERLGVAPHIEIVGEPNADAEEQTAPVAVAA